MSAEEGNANGLSLEGLAQRLQTLEQENERMRSENAELRSKVVTLEGSETGRAVEEPASSSQRRVSRSRVLRNAGAAAVGTMAAGALLARDASVAKADHFAPGISVDYVITHLEGANLTAVLGNAPNGEGVVGFGKANGVRGNGRIGVTGVGEWGVWGETHSGPAVAGVMGYSSQVVGVAGTSAISVGVVGRGGSYGGEFFGGKAQLKLTPKGTAGKPTSGTHTKGEIYMDSAGTLFVCTANGTPGTWRMVTTTAV
jgi:hypothetical protein